MNLDIDRLNDPAALWAADTVYRPDLFAGKVALVSGAGSGLGRACALLFARLGARLVICGRTPEKLEAVAEFVRDKGGEVLVVPTNVREPDQVDALFAQAHAHYGRIDCTVNNAGGQFPQAAIDFAPKGWSAVINNNLNGTWLMMQRAAQYWRDLGPVAEPMLRSICNIVVVIERGMPGVAHTVAARAGIIGATRTVAVEWAPLGIRVNCIAPGLIATEGLRVYPPEAQKEFPIANPMKRPGTPMEIAESCIYVSASSGSFMTGEVVTVDGGGKLWGELWTAGRPEWYRH
ncbi:SDR family NAD(P)-dependent oxidoreductase [Sinimarinibacterium flocculans]|uniref:Peroxisomal trans-2-enoyl-CoA reductase n=1 Tax=Sinimarinibacterium flocculans TaxID=985250 RepID=A0A318E4P7_9GAMM|nr:SDR family oxidoreductase [Sinimarinibacterium flocculans]PXV65336.1 citronellol/citronellal dehydrogenase [Sinimarinibacterium flocculans]